MSDKGLLTPGRYYYFNLAINDAHIFVDNFGQDKTKLS